MKEERDKEESRTTTRTRTKRKSTSPQRNRDKMLQACAIDFEVYAVGQNGTLTAVSG